MSRVRGDQVTKKRLTKSRRLLASLAAFAMVGGAGIASASPAFAADPPAGSDPVRFADNQLLACVNEKLGGGRGPSDPVTFDALNTIFGLSCGSQFSVSSLDGIEHAQKISNLFFAGGKHDFSQSGSLAAAAKMPKLNSLTLTDAQVSNASFADIGTIEGLTTLSVTGNQNLTDITPLSSLEKLSKLDLSKNAQLADLSPLSGSTKLRDFTASQNPLLVDLSPLRTLKTLTSISVYKTAVESLEPLSELTEITNLSAGYTNVATLAPLVNLTKMRNLSIEYAKLDSLAGIENMSDLRTLEIHHNSGIGDNLGALGNKTELTRLHMDAIGATSLEPLFGLTGLVSLQAMGNAISSLVGLQDAPETASKGTFAVTAQRIAGPEQYVPKGAKQFRHDATGQLANRDGSFPAPGGNLKPIPDPELPLMSIEVIKAWETLEYTFAEDSKSNDRFTGTVAMPIVWSTITSEDSATIPLNEAWAHEVTFTAGFPMAQVTLTGDAPAWLSVDGSSLKGTPTSAGDWTFTIEVSDALGNTMTQRFDLTVPKPNNSYFEISEDQSIEVDENGDEVTFYVSRTDAVENPYTNEASVRVRTVDGTALAGVHYEPLDETITWAAGNSATAKPVQVKVIGGAAGGDEVALTVELSEPTPPEHTELGGGFTTDLTITYPQPEPSVFSISKPQLVSAAAKQPGHQAGDGEQDVTFTVTRTDSAVNPWRGGASVDVKIYDPMAGDGESYAEVVSLVWQPNDAATKDFTITVKPGNAGDPKRVLGLQVTSTDPPESYAKPASVPFSALAITYPTPEATVFTVGDDQGGDAGDTLTFTVSRADAAVDPWTGEASVRVTTVDGSAVAGKHYNAIDEVLVWAAGETGDKTVDVVTKKVTSESEERTFTLVLSEPSKHAAVDERAEAIATLTYEVASGPGTNTGGQLANTGSSSLIWAGALGAAILAIIAGSGLALARRRR
ncbi:Calx-beta domain-containing protein [Leucobacter sp. UT-8R-CII-1-4]|uniref:Calx-beta domain-containing protein n=1 Tax=Leucobacter sp. UT-8R-CII-1-4 TaxID=3040075 RepID=UPI0024A9F98E|nr:Calx-beta domain-containing protein [Leucobacter sp. UT-8R-CII-1-4]MDI6022515.1 Calx-beta domain-containing protein [Leucobacter sp. UT-8R-CII-1-4]